MKAHVVGSPIEHSLSPQIFQFLSQKYSKKLSYEKKEVTSFREYLKEIGTLDSYLGCNITFPLKFQAFTESQHRSPDVEFLKSANVVKKQGNEFYFYNTDWLGFQNSLMQTSRSALVLGGGNTARSILYALGTMQVPFVDLRARSPFDWKPFQEKFPKTRWGEESQSEYDLVVNTIPAEATLEPEFLKIPIQDSTQLYDVNYRGVSPLLTLQKNSNPKYQNGLSMLIHQALLTWEIWWDVIQDKTQEHEELQKYLGRFI